MKRPPALRLGSAVVLAFGIIATTSGAHGQSVSSREYKFGIAPSLASCSYFVFYPAAGPSLRVVAPWKTEVSYCLNHRIKFRLGYGFARFSNDYTDTGTNLVGQPTSQFFQDKGYDSVLPATVSYNFRASDSRKFNFGVVAGLMFAVSAYNTRIINTLNGVTIEDISESGGKAGFYTVSGVVFDYRLNRRLDLTGELSWNRSFASVSNSVYRSLGSRNGFTRNMTFGLRYVFNFSRSNPTTETPAP